MNPYKDFVRKTAENLRAAKNFPLGNFEPHNNIPRQPNAPVGVIFSPHPDDECINGGLPLRLFREAGFRIVNVPVTFGSNPKRQSTRKEELSNACRYLGFEIELASKDGFEKVNLAERENNVQHWDLVVEKTVKLLQSLQPEVVFFPHQHDRHPTHCGTSSLVLDALNRMPEGFSCTTIENEYWQAMEYPNLMVELDEQIVSDLVTALTFHIGEVERNSYHVSLPSWLIDNVRRGSELIGLLGGGSQEFIFAVFHKVSIFRNNKLQSAFEKGEFLSTENDLLSVFNSINKMN